MTSRFMAELMHCRSSGTAEPGKCLPGWLCGVRNKPQTYLTAAQYEWWEITHVCNS